jgi:hypothetical protein
MSELPRSMNVNAGERMMPVSGLVEYFNRTADEVRTFDARLTAALTAQPERADEPGTYFALGRRAEQLHGLHCLRAFVAAQTIEDPQVILQESSQLALFDVDSTEARYIDNL